MPFPLIPILGGAAVIGALGYGADKTGEGINDAATGFVKIGLVVAIGYVLYKKVK